VPLDEARCDEALDHLLAALWTFTHRVEIDETQYPQTAVAYLDLGRLNERDLHSLAEQIVASAGGDVRIGLAHGKFPAFVAAARSHQAGEIVQVAPGTEAAFVAPHPVGLLPLSRAAARKLSLLFIHQIGELAALSRPALVAQFGRPGRQMYWLAQGIDGREVIPRRMPQTERAARGFDAPLTERVRLDVVIHDLADALAARLEARVAAAHHLTLTLQPERGTPIIEHLHLLQPVASAQGIAQALQPLLARTTVGQGIVGIEITLMQFVSAAPRQLELLTHRPARQQLIDLTPALVERYGRRFYEAALTDTNTLLDERRFHLRRIGGSA
jgi:nucleotidyltransferase/DNA polymerase involved in DNA repair